jgi:predicted Zn-dependent protease
MSKKSPHFYLLIILLLLAGWVKGQPVAAKGKQPDSTWIGQRIIMLKGFGEVNSPGENGHIQIKRAPNIVAPVVRIEGNKVWIVSPGEIQPTGWIDTSTVILLTEAIPYFTAQIEKSPKDWDAYFRRADAEHALNKREEAITDYTMAIQLHPGDPYLYFRRARSYHARQICDKAIADYGEVILFTKDPAEAADAYSRQAGIYANCRDSLQQNSKKAIAAAKKAVSLDHQHPTYLTLLAAAYERDGQLKKAIAAQKKALASPAFPPGYREEATNYLQSLEKENNSHNK